MTIDQLRALPVGTKLTYVFGENDRHPATLDRHAPDYTGVLIYWTDKPQQLIRWSARTNRPVGTRGFAGDVRLELVR